MPTNRSAPSPEAVRDHVACRSVDIDQEVYARLYDAAILTNQPPSAALAQAVVLYTDIVHTSPGRIMRSIAIGATVKAVIIRTLPARKTTPTWAIAVVVAAVATTLLVIPAVLAILRG